MIALFIFLFLFLSGGFALVIQTESKKTIKNSLVKSLLSLLYVVVGILYLVYAGLTFILPVPFSVAETMADLETIIEREIKRAL